jgi:hypothetical protein
MIARREDWPLVLNQWVDDNRSAPFEWHRWDCCSAAADWVRVCTGRDLFAAWADRYQTGAVAQRLIKKAGGLRALIEGVLGPALPAEWAQRGDVVLVEIDGRESLAVCLGGVAAGPGEDGMAFVKLEGWLCAWRV